MSSDPYHSPEPKFHETIIKIDKLSDEQNHYIIKERAVWRALFANLGIAGLKFGCWLISNSSALLSESIHSAADGFNSLCLIIGLKRGSKPADKFHPFGYGLEANIWAIFASIIMLIGTAISLYNGWIKLFISHHSELQLLENYNLIALTLVGSILFEGWAVSSASRAVIYEAEVEAKSRIDAFFQSIKHINQIKSPTTKFVWYEDVAALAGVIVALIALTIAKFGMEAHYAYIPDAIASIIIGFMLLGLAFYLLRYNVNFVTGSSAKPDVEENIMHIAENTTGVSHVIDLKTMDMGSSGLIINMGIEVDPEIQVKEADDIADKLEIKLKEKIKNVSHITIEVQASDAEDDWKDKFKKLVEEGKAIDVLTPKEASMLSKFFDFTDTVVYEIMIPRTDVKFIDTEATVDELIDVIISSGHTRIPVYEENIDNITGIVNAKDVLKAVRCCEDKSSIKIKDLVREITIVPENKSISSMLNEFNLNKSQIAAVVDEHGGVAGIVTVEDVLEEIVGEIWDEYDVEIPEIIKIDDQQISVYSKMNIYDLNERFGLDFPTEDFQTIGGYIFGLLGREPEVGDEVEANDIKMKVESMDGHKIVRAVLFKEDGFVDSFTQEE
jgi:cation diffusion facilitator family transporter